MKRITMFLGAGILLLCSMVFAAVPQLINFQGILRDGSGNPVANGSYSVTFTIYDAPSAGNALWTETQSVTTSGGLFTVLLGAVTPVPDAAFNNPDRWLGIQVSPDPEMTPRQSLVSMGYGYRVNSVNGALGGSINGSLSFGNSATPIEYIYESGVSNPSRPVVSHSPSFPNWGLVYHDAGDQFDFQANGISNLLIDLDNLGSPRVGVATTSPNSRLHVGGRYRHGGYPCRGHRHHAHRSPQRDHTPYNVCQ